MGHLRPVFNEHPLIGPDPGHRVARHLVERGALSRSQLAHVMTLSADWQDAPDSVAVSEGLVTPELARASLADILAVRNLSTEELAGATPELHNVPPAILLRTGVLPCRLADGELCLVISRPLDEAPAWLDRFSGWPVAVADRVGIQDILAHHCRDALIVRAECRVADIYSCRNWGRHNVLRIFLISLVASGLLAVFLVWPIQTFVGMIYWCILTLVASCLLKCSAALAQLRYRPQPPRPDPSTTPLPKISIMVPLFREEAVLTALIDRLGRLIYPRSLLEVILVIEENDQASRDALAGVDLPRWMRVIVVPDADLKTKPRAMNYALDFCSGSIIGVYDAEDAPEPDQLIKVAERFQTAPPDLACLQGILDFYNPRQNWLARCFTTEYATWFRLILPGFARLGFAIPLGGTTFFISRDVLDEVGAWDAYNVTEDADLGFRLMRLGYRSEMIDCVTYEEANCRLWPWIRQRSRWLKGYMVTYLVHMRTPLQLRRDLGWWLFLGFQAHFLSALFQFLLAPVLWSFWLVVFGHSHPLSGIWPEEVFVGLGLLFLFAEGITLVTYMLSVNTPRHVHLMKFAPTMHFYWPLSFFAICKGMVELLWYPFFWDKTTHGLASSEQDPSDIPELEAGDKGL